MAAEKDTAAKDMETVSKAEIHYGEEPPFPWPLMIAWAVFATWGLYYIATRLVPAYSEWATIR